MQQSLIDVYTEFKGNISLPEDLLLRVAPPLMLKVTPAWEQSSKRVLVVGQETLDWSFDNTQYADWPHLPIRTFREFLDVENSVSAMVDAYGFFDFAKGKRNHSSPFWRTFREIRHANGDSLDGIESTVLWTNLYRMSLDGGSVIKNAKREERSILKEASRKILLSEIEVLKPTAVVFFTGPYYNDTLYEIFDQIELKQIEGHDKNRTGYIEHSSLPPKTIRTYHPGYLSRGKWHVLRQVVDLLK